VYAQASGALGVAHSYGIPERVRASFGQRASWRRASARCGQFRNFPHKKDEALAMDIPYVEQLITIARLKIRIK
jgi:hypothetical protein